MITEEIVDDRFCQEYCEMTEIKVENVICENAIDIENKINNLKNIVALNITREQAIKIKRKIYIQKKKQHVDLIELILKSSIKELKLGNDEFFINSFYSPDTYPNDKGYIISLLENNRDFRVIRLFLKMNCNILLSHNISPNDHHCHTGIFDFVVKRMNCINDNMSKKEIIKLRKEQSIKFRQKSIHNNNI